MTHRCFKRSILKPGTKGALRRVPIFFLLLILSLLMILSVTSSDEFKRLLIFFNDNASFDLDSFLALLMLGAGYAVLLFIVAITKIISDYLVDGE